ncbi:MAG: ECF transporter S component [Defluviitaleaceae bacterium]|nr:ECF transporter S component [Defluviitaleaceae bacterium]
MSNVKNLVLTALLVAVVYMATAFINVPLAPDGGLVHLGSVALFAISSVFGKWKGAVAGSLGMAMFNLTSIWVVWAPFTFVIRFVMGYIIGTITHMGGHEGKSLKLNLLAVLAAGLWFIPASYVAGAIILSNWAIPVTHIPGNVTQIVLMLVLGVPLANLLNRHKKHIM